MAKTYIDQIVEYPAKIIQRISSDDQCVALLTDKSPTDVGDEDRDAVINENLFDYQYVDKTTQTTGAYIWVEMEVDRVMNRTVKGTKIYVTIACHKNYMRLNRKRFRGIGGNRRDNLVRFVDRVLNDQSFLGIGALSLSSVRTLTPINGFAMREIVYSVPDFNIVSIEE